MQAFGLLDAPRTSAEAARLAHGRRAAPSPPQHASTCCHEVAPQRRLEAHTTTGAAWIVGAPDRRYVLCAHPSGISGIRASRRPLERPQTSVIADRGRRTRRVFMYRRTGGGLVDRAMRWAAHD